MRRRKIALLVHEALVPPEDPASLPADELALVRTELDVLEACRRLGHDIRVLGLSDSLLPLRDLIEQWRPHLAVNLLEEFHGNVMYDQNVVSYLELANIPYTGCNPRGLILARDKALSKKILSYHRIPAPKFTVYRRGRSLRRPAKALGFPLIVKPLNADASLGIAEASVVHNEEKLRERVSFIHRVHKTHAIVEQYIDGRELYVGVMGHHRLTTFPVWELFLDRLRAGAPKIATRRAKWDKIYQTERGVALGRAEPPLPPELCETIERLAKRIYRALELSGYARIDFRLTDDGRVYFLEANPNPDMASDGEFAHGANDAGLAYDPLVGKILSLGVRSLGD